MPLDITEGFWIKSDPRWEFMVHKNVQMSKSQWLKILSVMRLILIPQSDTWKLLGNSRSQVAELVMFTDIN